MAFFIQNNDVFCVIGVMCCDETVLVLKDNPLYVCFF